MVKNIFITAIVFILFSNLDLRAFNKLSLNEEDTIYEFKKSKDLRDRFSSEVFWGINLSFLQGQDAKSVKSFLRANTGSTGIRPRTGFYFQYKSYVETANFLDLYIGVGYDMRGWVEQHKVFNVNSVERIEFDNGFFNPSTGLTSNDVYVRTDYINFSTGIRLRPTNFMNFRVGIDMGVLALHYARINRFFSVDATYFRINRPQVNNFLPALDLGLGFGKIGFFTIDLGMQYSGQVFENVDYRYLMLKIGLNYGFNFIPDGAGTM